MRTFLHSFFLLFLGFQLSAQHLQFFKPVSSADFHVPDHGPLHVMSNHLPETIWRLDNEALKTALLDAPAEHSAAARQKQFILSVPMSDGHLEEFSVWQIPMLDPELAAAYPEIRTYAGESLAHGGRSIRFSVTYRGFRAMILEPDLNIEYVEPVMWEPAHPYFIAYDRRNLPEESRAKAAPSVSSELEQSHSDLYTPDWAAYRGAALSGAVQLRTIRLTVSTTAEFSIDHGGTKELSLSAVTEYSNMVSAFFERDAQLRLQLTPCTQNVIYTNPSTDPFSGSLVTDWMSQNENAVTLICGWGTHDIGHVYARYMGGSAIGVAGGTVCTSTEDRGCSAGQGQGNYGDGFLSVIGQEMGHQLSGGHTWNRCNGGGGRAGNSAFEPGSGSTIMSYAGSCGSDNVQGYTDLYFHSGSVDEFHFFFNFGIGPDCATVETVPNNHPIVTLPYQDNFFIPIQTPFELNGTASDPDGDPLAIAWEQMDTGPETPLESPQSSVPIFRVWPAGAATNRVFPKMSTVLSGSSSLVEQLPTYTRDMTFRMFARDNKPGGGGIGKAEVAFKAWGEAGPFKVSVANSSGTIWKAGELVEITWDVANTNVAPVNCQSVNIRLSKDNGQSWPITLASGVGNDGHQYVLVPNEISSNARLRIDAADNVFFAVSKSKFSIQAPTQASLTLGLSTDVTKVCLPATFQTEILSAATLGLNVGIDLAIDGDLPPGATATFSSTHINAGQPASLYVDMSNVTTEGTFTFNVKATPEGGAPLFRPISITTTSNDFSALKLISPADGLVGAALTQTLRWNKASDAEGYDVQLSSSPDFSSILSSLSNSNLDSFKMNILLEKGKAYYWRVRPRNECGVHAWTEPFFFSTFAESCQTYMAGDVPKNISAGTISTVESKITLPAGGTISDVNVAKFKGYHESLKDLEVHLISPQLTDVLLFTNKCGSFAGYLNFGLDDAAATVFTCPPSNAGIFVRPANPLAPFIGQNSAGTWILRIKDKNVGSGGTLEEFHLELCASISIVPPIVSKNIIMPIEIGTNKVVSNEYLIVADPNNSASQLIYTLVTVPSKGELHAANGTVLKPGDTFTQANIDAGDIRYFHYGADFLKDKFRFVVTDGEGGFLGTPTFEIEPFSAVNTVETTRKQPTFALQPNPASNQVWLKANQAATQDYRVSVMNAVGQLIQTSVWGRDSERLSISVAQWPKGGYWVRIEGVKGVSVLKLVVE